MEIRLKYKKRLCNLLKGGLLTLLVVLREKEGDHMYPVQSSVLIEDGKHYIGHHYIVGDVYYAHVELISELERKSAFGKGDTSDLAINDGVNKIKEDN